MKREQRWIPGALAAICATFMGTVVGAGFASGREIFQFFTIHGIYGWGGIILACLIMGWAGVRVYQIAYYLKPRSYREIFIFLLGPRLAAGADLMLSLFFMILIAVMFAGSGAIFEACHLGYWFGLLITAALLVSVLWRELDGLIALNLLVIPLMFFGSLLVSGNAIVNHQEPFFTGSARVQGGLLQVVWSRGAWFLSALQFSSYNLVMAIPVLLALAKRYPFPKVLKWGGWVGCLGLGLMTAFINWALLSHFSILRDSALPMVELAKKLGPWGYLGYALILWGEMVTTLLANTYGLAVRLVSLTRWPFRFWVICLTLAGAAIAQVGFVSLIAKAYPFYGVLCFILIVLLLVKRPKNNSSQRR